MTTLEDIERQAFSLPEDQRLLLAQKLISSVDEISNSGVEEAWESEINERIESYQSGQIKPISASKVFSRLKEITPE
jgi:putative addiction module component (TIGR02574 family)